MCCGCQSRTRRSPPSRSLQQHVDNWRTECGGVESSREMSALVQGGWLESIGGERDVTTSRLLHLLLPSPYSPLPQSGHTSLSGLGVARHGGIRVTVIGRCAAWCRQFNTETLVNLILNWLLKREGGREARAVRGRIGNIKNSKTGRKDKKIGGVSLWSMGTVGSNQHAKLTKPACKWNNRKDYETVFTLMISVASHG